MIQKTTTEIEEKLENDPFAYRDYDVLVYLVEEGRPIRSVVNEYGWDVEDYKEQLKEHGLTDRHEYDWNLPPIDYDYVCSDMRPKTRSVRVDPSADRAMTDGGDWLDARSYKAATGDGEELDGYVQVYTSAEDAKSATQIRADDAPKEKRKFYTKLSELNDGRGNYGSSNNAGEYAASHLVVNKDKRLNRRWAEATCDGLGLSGRQKTQVLKIVATQNFASWSYIGKRPEPFYGIIAFVLYEDVDTALQDPRFYGHEETVEKMHPKLSEKGWIAGHY
ncbi:hypothetical protein C2R22_17540 [Salinigranum rubrum]|uniref:Uncharacterized protein n=1 Tax=Salinigranum rubrum TaxID=755307 RepID=A0A2I8VMR3_9EURY|nr:hypothetical protein [Salinigranum rubrum]AUV83222.1 hypothetical protein C2R22_17540 [Salinigranum rubrum]